MNFTAYIQRQKNLIRDRHEGATFLTENGEIISIPDRKRLLFELDSLKGLNLPERINCMPKRTVEA